MNGDASHTFAVWEACYLPEGAAAAGWPSPNGIEEKQLSE